METSPRAVAYARIEHESAEPFNVWSAVVGAALAVAGAWALQQKAADGVAAVAYGVYGATLVGLFVATALHHAFPHASPERLLLLRRLDHCAIYLFIAGNYTPLCLLGIRGPFGDALLAVAWTAALVGIVAKVREREAHPWTTVLTFAALAGLVLVAAVPLWQRFSADGLLLLGGGGAVYALGAVVYASGRPDPAPQVVGFHGLWHVFILVAATMHYAFVLHHLPAAA